MVASGAAIAVCFGLRLTENDLFLGWLLFGRDFDRKPREVPVTEVSVVSAEMFDILVNNIPPSVASRLEKVATQPDIEQSEPPIDPVMDVAPEKTTQSLSLNVQNDTLPESVPDKPVRMEEVVIIPPVDLKQPKVEDPKLLETSLAPKPRPALRVAPVAVAPPAPDIDIGEITRDATAPQLELAQVVKEQAAKAPEAAAPEIVTEAEKPSASVEVSKLAPPRTVRPKRRPAPRPVVETPIDLLEPTAEPIDPLAAALAEALVGTPPLPEAQGTATDALKGLIERVIKNTIKPCWNVGFSSTAALSTIVRVRIEFTSEGKPLANGITFEGAEGGDAQSAQQAFETARSAIKKCGARGFNLPKNEFPVWRTLILTFNPAEMRLL